MDIDDTKDRSKVFETSAKQLFEEVEEYIEGSINWTIAPT